ncbi:hypothetical protein R1CP_39165 (plasmid) [Rhodococcus opacus]|uniref:Uncharacterized protein n=1 Tax=Rhodococcus opacus TaxID=37919 RepID=A0A1B1KI84_RHOOP|nr:hypothetical protein R1CP_38660 [Rhodococcus opacus]ANS32417.1 hypothetical protein R1CP_39165 [Rhodococcus opacus]
MLNRTLPKKICIGIDRLGRIGKAYVPRTDGRGLAFAVWSWDTLVFGDEKG